jgi:hypothetical protein
MNIHTKTNSKCNKDSSNAKYNRICKKTIAMNTLCSNTRIDTESCTKYRDSNMDDETSAVANEALIVAKEAPALEEE